MDVDVGHWMYVAFMSWMIMNMTLFLYLFGVTWGDDEEDDDVSDDW